MSDITVATPPAALRPPAAPSAFSFRLGLGLVGVLMAVLVAGFNEHVTESELADIRGGMGIGYDDGTWLTALYEAFNVSAMAFAPWFAATFSIRRLTIVMVAIFGILAAIMPFAPNLSSLYVLRSLQGFSAGCLPPMLMSVALRFLPAGIKVYGLGAYALTATFGPNMGTPIGAFLFEGYGLGSVFWEIIPFCIASMICVGYGLPVDPYKLERFKLFDWRGALLGLPGISMLIVALMQGDRLDWFNSPLIRHLMTGGGFLFVLFLINEWFHPAPFFRLQMLKSRDLTYALVTVAGVLMLAAVTNVVPADYLIEVRDYRPLQIVPLSLLVALPQLLALPLVAALCNIRWVDCRVVAGVGLALMGLTCFGSSFLTSDWIRGNFYLWQGMLVLGEPMAVIPILMLATGKLAPTDGPFVSGMFNMVKAFANVLAAAVVDILMTWREHTHSNILIDHLGGTHLVTNGFGNRLQAMLSPMHADPAWTTHEDLARLAAAVHDQALVLASSDIYLAMVGVTGVLVVFTIFTPTRIYPPRPPAPPTVAAR